jgi:hypothetical protein
MVDIKTVTVKLGEREYIITEAGFMRAKKWKSLLMGELKPLFDELNGAQNISFDTPSDLLKIAPFIERIFLQAIDTIFDLLLVYAPSIETDKEYIENHATDTQIFAAFQEVIKLADFLGLTAQFSRRIGRTTIGTSSS